MLKKMMAFIFLVLLTVNTCGCLLLLAGAAGGGGTAAWLSGKLVQEVNAPFDKTIQATKSGLKSLDLNVAKETRKESVAQIMSNYSDGRTVWIDIHRVSSSSSRVEVRVGAVSDREAASKILDKIMRYL